MRQFKPVTIYYRKIIPVSKTRFPWFHINFSGIPGWKQGFIEELEDKIEVNEEDRGTLKVLFKAFGSVVMLDSDKTEFWLFPKLITTPIRFGWLYWAIVIAKGPIYYVPEPVIAQYKLLADNDNLCIIFKQGMNTGNLEMVMDAMDIMLKLDYSIRIQFRVVSKSGDRIKYTVTYPNTRRIVIESVNGISNQVLAAKYHHILSTGDLDDRKRNLLYKDNMTPEQLEWLAEVD